MSRLKDVISQWTRPTKTAMPDKLYFDPARVRDCAQKISEALVGYTLVEVNIAYGYLMSQTHDGMVAFTPGLHTTPDYANAIKDYDKTKGKN